VAARADPDRRSEVSMDGTNGARILSFPRPETAQSSSQSERTFTPDSESAFTHHYTPSVKSKGRGFLGISDGRIWKSKLYSRNPDFPKVSTPGCFFIGHSGGFQLIHRGTLKYLGHYTRSSITLLEKQYGKKKRRSKNSRG
jgi:hypothetical protein